MSDKRDGKTAKLGKKDWNAGMNHYSGNCFSCPRCDHFQGVFDNRAGAVEAYAKFMLEEHGVKVKIVYE